MRCKWYQVVVFLSFPYFLHTPPSPLHVCFPCVCFIGRKLEGSVHFGSPSTSCGGVAFRVPTRLSLQNEKLEALQKKRQKNLKWKQICQFDPHLGHFDAIFDAPFSVKRILLKQSVMPSMVVGSCWAAGLPWQGTSLHKLCFIRITNWTIRGYIGCLDWGNSLVRHGAWTMCGNKWESRKLIITSYSWCGYHVNLWYTSASVLLESIHIIFRNEFVGFKS